MSKLTRENSEFEQDIDRMYNFISFAAAICIGAAIAKIIAVLTI